MERSKAWGIGLGCGLVVAVGLIAARMVLGRIDAPPCPAGWTDTTAPVIAGATPLRACVDAVETGPRARHVALYRTIERSPDLVDRALRAAAGGALAVQLTDASDASTRAVSANGRLSVTTRTVDAEQAPLDADVYLVAAGHRFGLLNIVHTPGSPFSQPAVAAAWMNTIQGASPWGAPDSGELRAHCPDGFETRPAQGPRSVVRCIAGLASSRFTLISLTWDEGGLGSDAERAQVATALASRVAQAQGTEARVVDGPTPFTLARNIDALRTRVSTGEHVPVSVRLVAAAAIHGSQHVLGIGVSEMDEETVPVLSDLFTASGATRPPSWLDARNAWILAAVAVALGAIASALLARRG